MPGRVRSRRQFARLAKPSQRGRNGSLRVQYVEASEPSEEFLVAYAIGKNVGNAVARNQLRRRLRVLMDEVRPDLAEGLYLIRCDFSAKERSYDQLRNDLRGALRGAGLLA